MNKSVKITVIFIAIWLLAEAGAIYASRVSLSDNSGFSRADAIVISGWPFFQNKPQYSSVSQPGNDAICGYLENNYGIVKSGYFEKNSCDKLKGRSFAYNGRAYKTVILPDNNTIFFDVTKAPGESPADSQYDGSLLENSIIFNAGTFNEAIDFMIGYLTDVYGIPSADWNLASSSAIEGENGRVAQKMDIEFADGSKESMYFEVTDIFKNFIEK